MEEIKFWKDWTLGGKLFLFLGAALFAFSVYLSFSQMNAGASPIANWKVLDITQELKADGEQFQYQLRDYNITTKGYLFDQYYTVTNTVNYGNLPLIYFIVLLAAGVFALTGISMIKKSLWMGIALAAFLAWFYFMRIDMLGILGVTSKGVMFGIMIAYIGTCYILNAFFANTPVLVRAFLFTVINTAVGWVLITQSTADSPAMHVAAYGMWAPVCITLAFILMVSYDFLGTFLRVITSSKNARPGMNFLNFMVISVIFVGNLFVSFLHFRGTITWELIFFNPIVLLLISSVLGLWGHKDRMPIFPNMLNFRSGGAFIYLAMAVTAFATIYYALGSGNTPYYHVLTKAILYIHLGSGALFMIYVLVNFFTPLRMGAPVHKILYTPQYLPYFVVRIGVGVFILYLSAQENYVGYNRLRSAFHGSKADIYLLNNKRKEALDSYKTCYLTCLGNQKGSIPTIVNAIAEQRYEDAVKYSENFVEFDPTPEAYTLLAHTQKLADLPFFDQYTLQSGIGSFPNSVQLHSNLGFVFDAGNFADSAYNYFERAYVLDPKNPVPSVNLLSLKTRLRLKDGMDSILALDVYPDDHAYQANRHFANRLFQVNRKIPLNKELVTGDGWGLRGMNYLNNYVGSQGKNVSAEVISIIDTLLKDPEEPFFEDLNYIKVMASAQLHLPEKLKEGGENLLLASDANLFPYYGNMVGKQFLRLNSPTAAFEFFERSWKYQFTDHINRAGFDLALLVSSMGDPQTATGLLQDLLVVDSSYADEVEEALYLINENNLNEILSLNQGHINAKYAFMNPSVQNPRTAMRLVEGTQDANWKGLTTAHVMSHFTNWGDTATSEQLWEQAKFLSVAPPVYQELQFQYLNYLIRKRNVIPIDIIADTLSGNDIGPGRIGYLPLFQAEAFAYRGELDKAQKAFDKAIQKEPFSSNVRWAAANFQRIRMRDEEKAYDILQKGVILSPKDPALLGQYIVQCGRLGYDEFAYSTLERLVDLTTPEHYQEVLVEFQKEQAALEAKIEEEF